jgi:hypothetical protein
MRSWIQNLIRHMGGRHYFFSLGGPLVSVQVNRGYIPCSSQETETKNLFQLRLKPRYVPVIYTKAVLIGLTPPNSWNIIAICSRSRI